MAWWRDIFSSGPRVDPVEALRRRLAAFRDLQKQNTRVLELIATAEEMLGGEYVFDAQSLRTLAQDLEVAVRQVVMDLNAMTAKKDLDLLEALERVSGAMQAALDARLVVPEADLVVPLGGQAPVAPEVAGPKLARLDELGRRLGCRIPEGFVVSTHAGQLFLRQAGVEQALERHHGVSWQPSAAGLEERAAELAELVLRAEVPRSLARAIERAVSRFRRGPAPLRLAVRSSALGEDSQATSFAGLYDTVLDVAPDGVLEAYKRVVASLFSARVIRYRLARGLHASRAAMAVGCLRMVPAATAGVVYTLDPDRPEREVMLVSAARGLGEAVVQGSRPVDRYDVGREAPHPVVASSIVGETPCLAGAALRQLAELALRIERDARCAQDIEWAIDAEGQLYLLQARPLRVSEPIAAAAPDLAEAVGRFPVLVRDEGTVACRGVGCGTVVLVNEGTRADELPADAVLVARTSSPLLSAAVERAAAVVTEVGTPTGHLATVARERRVPMIVDLRRAREVLRPGELVTVDTEENVIYQGRVGELLRRQLAQTSRFDEAPEFRMLRGLVAVAAPLRLRDPDAREFSAPGCTTYHDIVRLAHEKAVACLADGFPVRSSGAGVSPLELGIPLDLVLVDLGGGLSPRERPKARVEDLACRPLRAVLEGLTATGAWSTEPTDMDLDGFMSSATRAMSATDPGVSVVRRNLAIVTDSYLNLNLGLGYHFNIVDCFLSEERDENYIYFRFVGGVTEMMRRTRRVALLRRILEAHDFAVESKGDLIYGRIRKIPVDWMLARLHMIGRLIGFSRQLDILLRDDRLVERYADRFLEGATTHQEEGS